MRQWYDSLDVEVADLDELQRGRNEKRCRDCLYGIVDVDARKAHLQEGN